LLRLGGVFIGEGGGAEDFDLFLGGELMSGTVGVHEFLQCFDGVV
jgi:hypothetical protein